MTLQAAIQQYIDWKRAAGARFVSGAHVLRRYARTVGEQVDSDAVSAAQALAFLVGDGPLTANRKVKRSALNGFYRYALGRGLATRSPLPADEPRCPPAAPPYIYSQAELRRLLRGVESARQGARQLDAATFRTLLLTLYGAGLRLGEALRLTHGDVDLEQAVLAIRETKFHKTRLVPVGPHLARALSAYAAQRATDSGPPAATRPFFASRSGTPLVMVTVQCAFADLRRAVGVRRTDGARHGPRLHDLRHTFAVHRLLAWYREGADVQARLPWLATYLGHADISGTQAYLTLTPDLLTAASARFARYADPEGGCHD